MLLKQDIVFLIVLRIMTMRRFAILVRRLMSGMRGGGSSCYCRGISCSRRTLYRHKSMGHFPWETCHSIHQAIPQRLGIGLLRLGLHSFSRRSRICRSQSTLSSWLDVWWCRWGALRKNIIARDLGKYGSRSARRSHKAYRHFQLYWSIDSRFTQLC